MSWFDWLLLVVVAGTFLLLEAWALCELYRKGADR